MPPLVVNRIGHPDIPPKDNYLFEDEEWWVYYDRKRGVGLRERAEIAECLGCGVTFLRRKSRANPYHSRSCSSLNNGAPKWGHGLPNPRWNGGRTETLQGYIKLLRPDHPNAAADGYVLEHRYVMAEHLGRPLDSHEEVHHKNGVRDDNRIENLELWMKSQPPGIRVRDYHCRGCRCDEGGQ